MLKRKKEPEHMDESWLIPYSDMLTLLLALFIVLYAMSTVDVGKFEELKQTLNAVFLGAPGILVSDKGLTEEDDNPLMDNTTRDYLNEEKQLQSYQKQMTEYFEEMGISNIVTSTLVEQGLLITIQDLALFDSGKANVREESWDLLYYIGEILAQIGNEVQVKGHTDNLPINTVEFPSNWELSTTRALNVVKKFVENPELKPYRFSVVGYSEYRPIQPNSTLEGRAKNRRVELLIIREYPPPPLIDFIGDPE
ncbi:MAG: OmpA family protein [Syntrophomonadaceae bacterium]|nr:OmpA family protein [Syntrophomonadaceae bacterium]